MKFSLLLESTEKIESALGTEFVDFCDSLMMYISYNDKDSANDLYDMRDLLKKADILSKEKKVYKLVRAEENNIQGINKVSSTSTVKLKVSMLDDMKDMISWNAKEGSWYYLTFENVLGINVNNLYYRLKKNKKHLIKKYDIEYSTVSALFDALEEFKKQKEFIVFGNYNVKEYEGI